MVELNVTRTVKCMLPTHQHVATYNGYEVHQRQPGFEFTPMTLGKIASFIVQEPDGSITVLAFMYSMLASLGDPLIREDRLTEQAIQTIEGAIDRGGFAAHQDVTFEYHDGTWDEVSNPRWWISTSP